MKLCKNNIVWYAVEENLIYISKFYWNNKSVEETLYLEGRIDFERFNAENENPDTNFWIWNYNPESKEGWRIWECSDFNKRYFEDYPAQLYYKEMNSNY